MLQKILQILGILFLLQVIAVGVFFSLLVKAPTVLMGPEKEITDVRFVFNWTDLEPDQPYTIVQSHRSPRHPFGDHIEWACIDVPEISDFASLKGWRLGPEESKIMADVRSISARIGKAENCFGAVAEIDSGDVSAFVWSVDMHGRRHIEGATIIFLHHPSKRILYVSWMT